MFELIFLFTDPIPISEGVTSPAFTNWLIGALFLLLATIIGWLVLQVNSMLKGLTKVMADLKVNDTKMATQMEHMVKSNEAMHAQIMLNTNSVGELKGDIGVLKEWKRNVEKTV